MPSALFPARFMRKLCRDVYSRLDASSSSRFARGLAPRYRFRNALSRREADRYPRYTATHTPVIDGGGWRGASPRIRIAVDRVRNRGCDRSPFPSDDPMPPRNSRRQCERPETGEGSISLSLARVRDTRPSLCRLRKLVTKLTRERICSHLEESNAFF